MKKVGIHLKKIFVLFLLITGIYIGYMNIHKISWLPFGNHSNQADVTQATDKIILDIAGVSTTVIPENRDNLQADLKGKGQLSVKENGDSISVKYKRKWFDWFSFFDHSKLTIYIPENYNHNMEVNIGSGNLNYNGLETELENFKLDIGSGNIYLKNLKVNHFEHDGSSGNAIITSLTTKTGSFDLSSGNIILRHYSGKLKADLSSGNFRVQMDKLTDDVKVDVSSGNVLLNLPRNASFNLNGQISSGMISNDFPLKNQTESRQHLEGTHNSGKYNIDLDVSSGRIKIL